MDKLQVSEIVSAVNGKLLCGDLSAVVTSVSINSKEVKPGALFVPMKGARVDAHDFIPMAFEASAAATLTQNHTQAPYGASGCWIAVENTAKALQGFAAWYRRRFSLPVIGITGSVGKTTTKEMVAAALSQVGEVLKTEGNFNSQIGLPLTVFRIEKHHKIAVLEMGMSEFGEMNRLAKIAAPNRAVMTNIGLSHIEQLKTQENIRSEKLHIIDCFPSDGVLYLNGDDPLLWQIKETLPCRVVTYGTHAGCTFRAEKAKSVGESTRFRLCCPYGERDIVLPVLGIHNVGNALAAAAAALDIGLSLEQAAAGLESYRGVTMRQEIHHFGGITVIDDSYNASPDSMKGGLNVLCALPGKGKKIAVLGDMLELGKKSEEAHRKTGQVAAKSGVSLLLTVGERAKNIAAGAAEECPRLEVLSFENNEKAADFLISCLKEDDTLLVKGSRGMHMEEIVRILSEAFGASEN